MLKKITLFLAALLVVFVLVVMTRPADFRITRSATLAAAPLAVFNQVNDFHQWEAWSPWAKLDPAARNTFEGPASGEGAGFKWAGNKDVGVGGMTILESRPGEFIRIRLVFEKPFAATNLSEFTFKPEGSGTLVTWSMSGRNGFLAKAVGLFMDCDKMVGGQFEKGLANLKAIVEVRPKS